jgi:hypothetical protein
VDVFLLVHGHLWTYTEKGESGVGWEERVHADEHADEVLDPPLWSIVSNKLSLSVSLSQSHQYEDASYAGPDRGGCRVYAPFSASCRQIATWTYFFFKKIVVVVVGVVNRLRPAVAKSPLVVAQVAQVANRLPPVQPK